MRVPSARACVWSEAFCRDIISSIIFSCCEFRGEPFETSLPNQSTIIVMRRRQFMAKHLARTTLEETFPARKHAPVSVA